MCLCLDLQVIHNLKRNPFRYSYIISYHWFSSRAHSPQSATSQRPTGFLWNFSFDKNKNGIKIIVICLFYYCKILQSSITVISRIRVPFQPIIISFSKMCSERHNERVNYFLKKYTFKHLGNPEFCLI